ncbi:tetratricopeptide repeat protein [Puteibacter caeruleilacunae]|nr:tetratricopeptide repeat protein [Puteibacter caeruleilacunae]
MIMIRNKNLSIYTILILLFLSLSITSNAQLSRRSSSAVRKFQTATELYENGKYGSAMDLFSDLASSRRTATTIANESEFYALLCALQLGHNNSEKNLKEFLKKNGQRSWSNTAWFELGNVTFANENYSAALNYYKSVKAESLKKNQKNEFHFNLGYCFFANEEYDKALTEFNLVNANSTYYKDNLTYFKAHIHYAKEEYTSALKLFDQLSTQSNYKDIVPFYITHIFFLQEQYDKALEYAKPLLAKVDDEQKNELSKIIGQCYYATNKWHEAITILQPLAENNLLKSSDDYYQLAYCFFNVENYKEAAKYFQKATSDKSALGQSACYHLAFCKIQNNEKDDAQKLFLKASQMTFDNTIQEDASFNNAKLLLELGKSSHTKGLQAFKEFINKYPNSDRKTESYELSIAALINNQNYNEAITWLNEIIPNSPKLKASWQDAYFAYASNLYAQGDYEKAIENFKESRKYEVANSSSNALTKFWDAECHYQLKQYENAIPKYQVFLHSSNAKETEEFKIAHYNLGYCYFNLQQYSLAIESFDQYVFLLNDNLTKTASDAYNRLGDCYFANANYQLAINYYQRALDNNNYDPDYALLQQSFCYGLLKQQQQKINGLQQLLSAYPESYLAANALYEIGRAYEKQNNSKRAEQNYLQIVSNYQNSEYLPKAYLQLGLINYNASNYNKSLQYYKEIVKQNPDSKDAKAALIGIKNNYVELNQVDQYVAYTQSIDSAPKLSALEQDSLLFQSAEKLFMAKDPRAKQQLKTYLERYAEGNFALQANYYLGESQYQDQEYTHALEHFRYVVHREDNIFTEPALDKASELAFNANSFDEALELYKRLEKKTTSDWTRMKARVGAMRCSKQKRNWQQTLSFAQQVLSSRNINEAIKVEAGYVAANASLQLNKPDDALEFFKSISSETQTAEGAEAKFRVAQLLYYQDKSEQAEKEVMDYIKQGTPHQIWLGESFLLLAQIYEEKNDLFQAEYTLNSIIDNYPNEEDTIKEKAKEMLAEIKEKKKIEENNIDQQ